MRAGERTVVARVADLAAVAASVQQSGTLFEVALQKKQGELAGRGVAIITELQGDTCVVRHFRRGGSVMSALDDRYWRGAPNRVLRELQASEAARARGVATPAVKCGAWYTHGIFRRFDIATLYIPNSRDLSDVIFDQAVAPAAAEHAARLIRDMLRAGLIHKDLNLKNILIAQDRAFVLDLDRCRVVTQVSSGQAEAMRMRCFRSLAKWERQTGSTVDARVARSLGEAFRV